MKATKPRRGRRKLSAAHLNLAPIIPAQGETIQDAVYHQLRNELMIGSFAPFQTLSVRSIAEVLQTSVTPVKDALRRLVADGVLQANPQSAFLVPEIGKKRFQNITEARLKLETTLASAAAHYGDEDLVRRLEALNSKYAHATTSELLRVNYDFHFSIYDAAGMPDVRDLVRIAWMRIGPMLTFISSDLVPDDDSEHHRKILSAIEQNDGELAALYMERHIRSSYERVMKRLSS